MITNNQIKNNKNNMKINKMMNKNKIFIRIKKNSKIKMRMSSKMLIIMKIII